MTGRLVLALLAPLMLLGCVLTPGKFVSTLSIDADRTFAFTYKGEVIVPQQDKDSEEKADGDAAKPAGKGLTEDDEVKLRAMAEALSKEAGYKSVVYRGKGKFDIDYAIAGRLDHAFVFPFNTDAEVVFPFLVVEMRKDGLVRVKAPGFANDKSSGAAAAPNTLGSPSSVDASKYLDGVFTIDTDAEIVSQNTDEGAKPIGKRKTLSWRATPLTKDAPTAVFRLR